MNQFIHVFSNKDIDPIEKKYLKYNSFFLCNSLDGDLSYYILRGDLFKWLLNLNYKLSREKVYRLSKNQFNNLFRFICPIKFEVKIPSDLIGLGTRIGLITNDYNDYYFFPLARALNLTSINVKLGNKILKEIIQECIEKENCKNSIDELIAFGFSLHKEEVISVVMKREGFETGNKIKLRKLAKDLEMSPEGVRRREYKFWDKLFNNPERYLTPFYQAFLFLIISRSGSLIQYIGGEQELLFRFLCKCMCVSVIEYSQIGLILLSNEESDLSKIISKEASIRVKFEEVFDDVTNQFMGKFMFEDLVIIAKAVQNNRRDRIKSTYRVYLVLKQIGQAAHYSLITETHNQMFPEYKNTENNIHSYLTREEMGVVWIGRRGMFGLKEFGDSHPKMTLYERSFNIVEKLYSKTKRPVTINAISAEMGKHRKNINKNSLHMSIYNNPKLKRNEKGRFVPKKNEELIDQEKQDKLLEKAFYQFYDCEKRIDGEPSEHKVIDHKALFRCSKCGKFEQIIFYKKKLLYLECVGCKFETKYPSSLWGVNTTIPCPKCRNDFIIGFNPKYGPYLKCKKCDHWDHIYKYLIRDK